MDFFSTEGANKNTVIPLTSLFVEDQMAASETQYGVLCLFSYIMHYSHPLPSDTTAFFLNTHSSYLSSALTISKRKESMQTLLSSCRD